MPRVGTGRTYRVGVSSPSITPSPTPANLPQSSPQISHPLGLTPIVSPSPSSQNNDNPVNNNDQSDQTPPTSETCSSIDKRKFITIREKNIYPKEAFEMLKVIVHSHFDGPYSTWTSVDSKLKDFWWNKWKKLYRWDEDEFPEELVRKVFNHRGSKHLKDIFQKARENDLTKPAWVKEEIWTKLKEIWETDEQYQNRSDQNKLNRAVAKEKGLPPYRGGSRSTTDHKRKLNEELGHLPNPKETFTRCYSKKDGTFGNKVAEEIVEKYDTLMEQAIQDAASDGSNEVDVNMVWIATVGGPKKDSLFGMGSEAHSMIQATKYGVQDVSNASTRRNLKEECRNLKEELRAEFMAEISSIKVDFGEKVQQVESSLGSKVQQVEDYLGEKVQQVEDSLGEKVQQLEDSLQQLESTIGDKVDLMHKRIDNLVDKETLFDTMTRVLKNHLSSGS